MPERLTLVEDDLDRHDAAMEDLRTTVAEVGARVDTRLQRIQWTLITTSISLAMAAVMLFLNVKG